MSFIDTHDFPAGLVLRVLGIPASTYYDWRARRARSGSIGMSREGGQVRAAEAGRRGSVGHVEVFRMDGVGTSIVGRPRRLSADRRARPTYTLIWEEPR